MLSWQGEGPRRPNVIWIISISMYACNTETLMGVIQNEQIRQNYICFIVVGVGYSAELHEQKSCVFLSTLICIAPTICIR